MQATHDLALTVQQRADGQYIWMMMAASEPVPGSDALYYRPACTAAVAQPTYSSAFSLGVAELMRVAAAGSAAAN
ncbi:hypothetical protein ACSFA0_13940 [Variovorax sp. LT1P1]|uniref:hypothetical protein n=1 Tax=Variovorax sp. LT1P1 TaxID=3443730 RepID=UPI003F453691